VLPIPPIRYRECVINPAAAFTYLDKIADLVKLTGITTHTCSFLRKIAVKIKKN